MPDNIAHIRTTTEGKVVQTITEHLFAVSLIAKTNASKIGLAKAGELLGLLHDIGKFSKQFQSYIRSANGILDQDADVTIDPGSLKGKIDHSTAGAQYLWSLIKNDNPKDRIPGQLLAMCLVSHHSGLIDCLSIDGENNFIKRIEKADDQTHLEEVLKRAESEILERIRTLVDDPECFSSIIQNLKKIVYKENSEKSITAQFQAGMMLRMLFSCLIDSDRIDAADFDSPNSARLRKNGNQADWDILIQRLEKHVNAFNNKTNGSKVDVLRNQISSACLKKATENTGVFTLTVPTGGGKTLASLRFAMHHAKKHNLDRIIYVIPYTSIIDQNAQVVRDILEVDENEKGNIVLEHHSNLLPEIQSWKNKFLSENWDAPVVFTTSVQFLETLFGGGTRGARRIHQLANAVMIFDEVQTLPIKTTHMFCNAVNYLTNHCHSSAVLCTATQPLLNKVSAEKGRIHFDKSNEIMPDILSLFADLKRVEVINQTKPTGWDVDEIATLAIHETEDSGSCLIIVNTKKNARTIHEVICKKSRYPVYHLSTNMCPAHRMFVLNEIRDKLGKFPLICVSTQLIEAGVDVDFGSVIRFVAGLDSIAQAAGRCNRNGRRTVGKVFIVNPANETIKSLKDIKVGKEITTERIFYHHSRKPADKSADLLSPDWMDQYFEYYFYQRANEMVYPVDIGRDDNLLELLSTNRKSTSEHIRKKKSMQPEIYFRQSFAKAAEAFKAIDAPTRGIVVPYGEGEKVIADLFSLTSTANPSELLRKAQRYTVNVFPEVINILSSNGALMVVKDMDVIVLDKQYYHDDYGLSTLMVKGMENLII